MRLVGIETEYGIADPARPQANPILMSSRLVEACRGWADGHTTRWDYGGEDPLQDQRGQRRDRASAHADLLTDASEYDAVAGGVSLRRRRGSWEDPAHLNAVLSNGARFYVDHAHPEYSGPEVTTAHDAVLWDRAGDAIALAAAERYAVDEDGTVALYKNNVDGKGSSLRHPRELPRRACHRLRRSRHAPDRSPRHAAGLHRRGARGARAAQRARGLPACHSAPTTWRPSSDSRPRCVAPS
ncbi:hypothetical protein GCM10025876_36250 [Demequina litorisediminis]|uniref:Proteasome accessory factor PafA2 n=1 Tax=Demequina litorisediminis TaxID=1849022 RepID=A0ABQ6II66_9MICO|nr:hypothetical protein GCM10025876_36250 [Demequina litorisediminis]